MVMVTKEMAPGVGGGSSRDDNIFENMCIKLTGPSAEKLGEAFHGPGIVVLQELKGVEKEAADAEDPENSKEKEKELIINRIVRGALMLPPPGHGAEQVTEREGAMAGVKPAPVPPTRIIIAGTSGVGKTIKVLKQYRIVLLGRRGSGKSSLANTIFEEDVFETHHTSICGASECQTESKSVHGRRITLVDTPGFFDTDGHEEDMKTLITRCSPGPHVFLIVLKVEKFTEQEKVVIDKMCHFFSEEALKYAAVVFTHGDQLPEGMKIEEFVAQEKGLSDLVKKCGGRCHVVDNKNRKNQVAELLSTIDKLVIENKGGCYTNKTLQAAERETEETRNKESVGNMPEGDPSKTQNKSVPKSIWIKLTGPAAKSMVEAVSSSAVVVLQDTADKVQEGKEAREGYTNDIKRTEDNKQTQIEDKEEGDEETVETGEDAATNTEEVDERAEESNEKQATMPAASETKKGAGGALGRFFAALGRFFAALGGAAGRALAALGRVLGGFFAAFGGAAGGASAALGGASAGAGAAGGGSAAGAAGGGSATGGSSAAGAAGAVGSAAGAAGVGSAVGIFVGGVFTGIATIVIAIATAVSILKKWALKKMIDLSTKYSRRAGIILLVVAFFSLLLFSFCVKVPIAGTFLLWFGVLLMLLLSLALFLLL